MKIAAYFRIILEILLVITILYCINNLMNLYSIERDASNIYARRLNNENFLLINTQEIFQKGSANMANINQTGKKSNATIHQYGVNNNFTIIQRGHEIFTSIVHFGDNENIIITQY